MVPKKILVVDDSELLLELVRKVLEADGHQVRTVMDPLQALGFIQGDRPDLVLVDVRMPKVTGDMIVKIANQRGLASRIPVYLFSDLSSGELEERARLCGAKGFIRKSSGLDGLVLQVRELLAANSNR